ncbi:hypothetical protein AB0H83_25430 [Dactylosporangium sp. NPDC050688]|uniref:hypothetical protein n=1 Tax=Dactylosporangium sp. NPDC050688 TaxID=3157217 RepID=UPI0033EA7690
MNRCEWLGPAEPASRQVLHLDPDAWLDSRTETAALCGLAANPAAPVPVLLELLLARPEAVPAAFRRRALAAPLIEAMLRHPHPRIRAALAANRRVDPKVRLLLADDPNTDVVHRLRSDRSLPLPVPDPLVVVELDRLHKQWVRGLMIPEELAGEVSELISRDRRRIGTVQRHPEPVIRRALLGFFRFPHGDPDHEAVQALLLDESAEVRGAATELVDDLMARSAREVERADVQGNGYEVRHILSTMRLSRALVDDLIAEGDPHALAELAVNPNVPNSVVAGLIAHPEAQVRRRAAERVDLTADQLARLAVDADLEVRTTVSVHPGLSEEQRADIRIDSTESLPYGYGGDQPPTDSVRQSEAWARSVNPLLRRRAAQDPRLPATVVAALADDNDPGVRVRLAHHHPEAPPELLLRVFREHRSCSRHRLPLLPNFPRTGLSRLAGDSAPATRALVALDPDVLPDHVDQLIADPEPVVRRAMAACPRLPADRIVALLDHPELAESAAANPSLPEPQMWTLLR